MKPYQQTHTAQNQFQRIFEHNTQAHELVWHRDRKDRTVHIVEGTDWKFQLDNHIPKRLNPGDVVNIPANTFHRIIQGSDNLVVEITEHEPKTNQ